MKLRILLSILLAAACLDGLACQAITAKGTRCSRPQEPYCWQNVTISEVDTEPDWRVTVDGKPLTLGTVNLSTRENNEPVENLRLKGSWYQYGNFNWQQPVEVRVACSRSLETLEIVPKAAASKVEIKGGEIVFRAEAPFKLSFCPEGRVGALHLFANGGENPVATTGQNVIRYGAGVHEARSIVVRSNQTLWLDDGALVYGHLDVQGTNITVCGAGVISGAKFERFKGPGSFSNSIQDATNVVIRGVAFVDPYGWTLGVRNSRGVVLEGVKILGGRMINDDGVDIINSADVTIRDSFIRTQDDNIALKGLGYASRRACFAPVENIRIEGCTLWTDQANSFRLGFECDAPCMRNIAISNIDVLACSPIAQPRNGFWSHAVIKVQASGGLDVSGLAASDVRVAANGRSVHLIQLESALTWSRRAGEGRHRYDRGGTIRDCRFADIVVTGGDDAFEGWIDVSGRSERECVSNITFERIRYAGRELTESDPIVKIGAYTSDIKWSKP